MVGLLAVPVVPHHETSSQLCWSFRRALKRGLVLEMLETEELSTCVGSTHNNSILISDRTLPLKRANLRPRAIDQLTVRADDRDK